MAPRPLMAGTPFVGLGAAVAGTPFVGLGAAVAGTPIVAETPFVAGTPFVGPGAALAARSRGGGGISGLTTSWSIEVVGAVVPATAWGRDVSIVDSGDDSGGVPFVPDVGRGPSPRGRP